MWLDVTGATFEQLAQAAYALSSPRGLVYLHVREGNLTTDELSALINDHGDGVPFSRTMHMDYVNGRCCKFHVVERNGRRYTRARWYDHGEHDTAELLKRLGLERIEVEDSVVCPSHNLDTAPSQVVANR